MKNNKYSAFLLTLSIAITAAIIFSSIGMVIPWLLGPLIFVILIKPILPSDLLLYWPDELRNIALLFIGILLGASFTTSTAEEMIKNFPNMVLMTFLLISFSLFLAYLIRKVTGMEWSTALLGSFPGGLSQMVIVGEEMKKANGAVIAFMQTLRILLVVISVPLAAKFLYGDQPGAESVVSSEHGFSMETEVLLLLLSAGPLLIWLGQKIHMPVPFMIVPLLVVGFSQITLVPGTAVSLPTWLINGAQLSIGAHLGYTMRLKKSFFSGKLAGSVLVSNLVLLLFCFGLSEIFSLAGNIAFKDMFLAAAPGGMAEMSVTAMSIHADLAFVTSFQLFRLLFILLIVTPIMKGILLKKES